MDRRALVVADLSLDEKDPLGPILRQVCLLLGDRLVHLFGSSCLEVVPLVALSSFACPRSCLGNLCQEAGSCCMARFLVFLQGTCSFLFYRLVYLAEDRPDHIQVLRRSKGRDRRVAWDRILLVREDP